MKRITCKVSCTICLLLMFFTGKGKLFAVNFIGGHPVRRQTVGLPDSSAFKTTIQGQPVSLYILKNKHKAVAVITNYGARLVNLIVPDKNGKPTDVVLGYDSIKTYQKPREPNFGAVVGRYGNRIAKGKLTLNGTTYQLDLNNGENSMHGGFHAFSTQVFTVKQYNGKQVTFGYIAKDGEGGFPGELAVTITYTLTDDNALQIEYVATTTKPTVVNITNHSYFNLAGAGNLSIADNLVKIDADNYLPVDAKLIPTGQLAPVKGTPFDFTAFKTIGVDIGQQNEQLKLGNGYDHCFVLNKHSIKSPVATVKSPQSGISMEVYTDQPGMQLYTSNFLTGRSKDGKGGVAYPMRSALCLETEHFPDSPNQPAFPSTVLNPGEQYHTVTIYKFLNK